MKLKVSYRDIAKMLCGALPVEGQEYGLKVSEYMETIKRLPVESRLALKTAYIFSRKVPKEEREDMFQELVIAVLEVQTKDEPFAYAITRCDWRNWWRKYMTRQHYYGGSLNRTVQDSDGQEVELAELIVGEAEFENRMDGELQAKRIWLQLPDTIKPIINRRIAGYALNATERQRLSRYVKKEGYKLLLAAS